MSKYEIKMKQNLCTNKLMYRCHSANIVNQNCEEEEKICENQYSGSVSFVNERHANNNGPIH